MTQVKTRFDQARADLEQAASLREELDAARTSSQALNSRMKELLERTMEVELLREQLAGGEAEQQALQALGSGSRRAASRSASSRERLRSSA